MAREQIRRVGTPDRSRLKLLTTGVPGLDQVIGGGLPALSPNLVAGGPGSGKTTLSLQVLFANATPARPGLFITLLGEPSLKLLRYQRLFDVFEPDRVGANVHFLYLRPLDLSVDETLDEIRKAVERIGATRVVIDSISGFEMALAPAFREDFRESLYRLIGALTGLGVTIFSTVEVVGNEGGLQLTGYQVSFVTDDILSQRYMEIEGVLRKALVVVKMRGSGHSRDFRAYELTATGVQLGESLRDYDGIITGMPTRQLRVPPPPYPGLTEPEALVLEAAVRSDGMTPVQVAKQSAMLSSEVAPILERLLTLGYVSRKGARHKAVAQPRGS